MAKYTIELRDIVESGRNIFPFPYEFYDEKMRDKFERDFIRHFYFREIGCETVDRFILNLQDKMNVVFPVYNAMLRAGQIEYNVLDNYYLSETTKRTIESTGKSSGVSSTVGQSFDDQITDTSELMTVDGENTQKETGTSESIHNGTSETIHNGTSETIGTGKETKTETNTSDATHTETVENTSEKEGTTTGTTSKVFDGAEIKDQNVTKKYLDTPQGLTDLSTSKYITNMNQDVVNETTNTDNTETDTSSQTVTENGGSSSSVNGANTSDTEMNGETNTENATTSTATDNTETTATDTTTGETERNTSENTSLTQESGTTVTFKGEQRTTADNNTRHSNDNKSVEETEIIHKGNIGVDSDAVMIQKHLKLQQLIAKTFQMFFDECEDLFMLVY